MCLSVVGVFHFPFLLPGCRDPGIWLMGDPGHLEGNRTGQATYRRDWPSLSSTTARKPLSTSHKLALGFCSKIFEYFCRHRVTRKFLGRSNDQAQARFSFSLCLYLSPFERRRQ